MWSIHQKGLWARATSDHLQKKLNIFFQKTCRNCEKHCLHKPDSFNIRYSDDWKLFKNRAIFEFESICVQEDKVRDTILQLGMVSTSPISGSITCNSIEQSIFSCNSNPGALVESFVDALEALATQSKTQMKLIFLETETSVKNRLNQFFSALNQRRSQQTSVGIWRQVYRRRRRARCVNTVFTKTKKVNFLICRVLCKRFCYVFAVFGFNSLEYDNNLLKS